MTSIFRHLFTSLFTYLFTYLFTSFHLRFLLILKIFFGSMRVLKMWPNYEMIKSNERKWVQPKQVYWKNLPKFRNSNIWRRNRQGQFYTTKFKKPIHKKGPAYIFMIKKLANLDEKKGWTSTWLNNGNLKLLKNIHSLN